MTVLQTIAVAFAMFSAVPVPQFDWNEKNMRYSLCAFPLVGVLCGVLWCVCASLPLPAMVCAAGFCLIPLVVRAASIWMVTPIPATPFAAMAIPRKSSIFSRTRTAAHSP